MIFEIRLLDVYMTLVSAQFARSHAWKNMKMPFMKMLKSSGPNDFIVFYLLLFSVTSLKLRCLDGAFWTVLEDMSRSFWVLLFFAVKVFIATIKYFRFSFGKWIPWHCANEFVMIWYIPNIYQIPDISDIYQFQLKEFSYNEFFH